VKISVIIPVKNRADLIGATLRSVFTQSLLPYEVIVVDDHSTDDLENALKAFEGKNLVLLQSDGKGPGAARNKGMQYATGDAIQFLDSDDLISNNKFEVQAILMNDHGADFVYGPYVKAKEVNGTWQRCDAIMQYYSLPEKNLSNLVLEGWCLLVQCVLFKKDFLNEAGNWRTDLMTHEDREYWFRIASVAKTYIHENKSCVIYRQHGNQITDNAVLDKEKWLNGIRATSIIIENLTKGYAIHSLLMLQGQNGYSKKLFNKKFEHGQPLSISLKEKIASWYYALATGVAMRISRTGWKRMHKAVHSDQIFEDYLKKLS
jgi:glycosyltransferase involved in cell wall biosynthesis